MQQKELVIIGGGPGGYTAAIRAAQLGAEVTLIEKSLLGGTCLNWGCIPTKAMYHNALMYNSLKHGANFGIEVKGLDLNMNQVQDRKDAVVVQLRQGIEQLLKANGVEVLTGEATLVDDHIIKIIDSDGGESQVKAKRILLAPGSIPALPPIEGADEPGVFISDHMFNLREVPKKLVIIGGGVIGMEFACIFQAFGSEVVVLEYAQRILANVDDELVKRLNIALRKSGLDVKTGVKVTKIRPIDGYGYKVIAEAARGELIVEADNVLLATGRWPNTETLNLEQAGVALENGFIQVDKTYATTVPHISAIGDAIKGPMLAHVASEEGIAAVENMMGINSRVNYDAVPDVVFTMPELAGVGLTEEMARDQGIEYATGKFMYRANGKALAMGEEEGLVKIIADAKTRVVLGMHIMGAHASDLVHQGVMAVHHKMTVADITHAMHAHPTLSEVILEAALAVDGKAIHVAPRRRRQR